MEAENLLYFSSPETRSLVFYTLLQRDERHGRRLIEAEVQRCFSDLRRKFASIRFGTPLRTFWEPTEPTADEGKNLSADFQAVSFDGALSGVSRIHLQETPTPFVVKPTGVSHVSTQTEVDCGSSERLGFGVRLPDVAFNRRVVRLIHIESTVRTCVQDDEDEEFQLLVEGMLELLFSVGGNLCTPQLERPPSACKRLRLDSTVTPNTSICSPASDYSVSFGDSNGEGKSVLLSCVLLHDLRLVPLYDRSVNAVSAGVIRRGDVLAAVNGQRVFTVAQFLDWEAQATSSEEHYFTILRNGQKVVVKTKPRY